MIETAASRAKRQKAEAADRAIRAKRYEESQVKRRETDGTHPSTPAPSPAPVAKSVVDTIERIIADPNGKFTKLTAMTLTKRIKDSHGETLRLILVAHDREVWKLMGHSTWAAYVVAEFDFSPQRGYQLLNHIQTREDLSNVNNVDISTLKEGQTRPLSGLPPEQKVEAFKKATKTAGGKTPTGKQVAAAVAEMKPAKAQEVNPQPEFTPDPSQPMAKAFVQTLDAIEPRRTDALYNELMQAVETAVPGETRHQTALRYIRDGETESKILASRTAQQ